MNLWLRCAQILTALVTTASVAGCGGSTSAAARQARPYTPGEYRIGVEDLLEITVWKEPQLSTTAPVRPDGKVTVPVAGEIQAAGHTARELEGILARRLAERIASPEVTVVVKELNASRVFVLGEVGKPGAYPMRGAMTVVQALALAGGLTEFADRDDIVILRRGDAGAQLKLKLDLSDAYGAPIELAPGDTVVVP
jgi:polysaccharide export outer membrane protein